MTVADHRQVLEALRLARAYVAQVHGTIASAQGHQNTIVAPDLATVDAAIRIMETRP